MSAAVATLEGVLDVSTAGILLAGASGTLQVVASSDERMRLLELFELQNEQGPCTDCYRSGDAVHEPDLRRSDRWPLFTARAVEEGFGSVDAIPLWLREHRLGALNLFNEAPACPATTAASPRHWPTWRPSGCCRSGRFASPSCWPDSCSTRSTAA